MLRACHVSNDDPSTTSTLNGRCSPSRASADALASLGAREQAIALLAARTSATGPGDGRGPGNVGRNEAAQLFRYMLRSADAHPSCAGHLQAVAPGLVTVAGGSAGLGRRLDDGGAFFADLTATAWK